MVEKFETDSKIFITAGNSIRQELDLSARFAAFNYVDKTVSSEFAQSVCSLIEAVFIHGLRDAFFIRGSRYSKRPEPNFWPFVSKYTHRSIKLQIYSLNQIKTEVGKARAWIRIVLGERTLESYINLFSKDAQISQFYKKGSFIREAACIDHLNSYLQKLDSMTILAPSNSNLLNSWTPNPLILAGLIPGRFLNCYSRIGNGLISSPPSCSNSVVINNNGFEDEPGDQHSPEQATNALDLLLTPPDSLATNLEECSTSNVQPQPELFGLPSSNYVGEYLVDDNESVVSHPSMLLQFDDEPLFRKSPKTLADLKRYGAAATSRLRRISPSLIGADFGCSAEFDVAVEGDDDVFDLGKNMGPSEEQSAEVIVHRKKTGRRRAVSKSSAGGGSDGSSVGAFSRTHSANNLIKSPNEVSTNQLIEHKSTSSLHTSFELTPYKTEKLVEDIKITNKNSNELNNKMITFFAAQGSIGIEMPIPTILIQQRILQEMEFPPLGSSLHDELLLAERMAQEEALKGKDEKNEENDSYQISITSNNSEILRKHSSPQTLEMFNFTSINNNSTDSSTNDLPATFDEALRAFLAQGDKNTKSRMFQSESKKRLFSECSSSGGDLNKLLGSSSTSIISTQQFSPPVRSLSLQFPTTNIPFSNILIKSSSKKNISQDLIQSLAPIKDIPHISFQRDGSNFEEEDKDGDELIEIQPYNERLNVSFDPKNCSFSQNTTTLTSSYKLPKRLLHLIKIPVEKGLDAQNFRCKTCCRNIGVGFGQFKNCALNGNYYCEDCFSSGGDSLIPSYAILNTDFKPKYISNSSRVLLQSIMDQPLFKVDFLNPYIYEHSKNMRKIRDIRRKLGYSVMYLLSCKNSVANDIRRRLWPHNHLHSDIHAYSLMDLECVANGTLERRLSTLLASTLSHIWDCPLCLQKGFFCELCSSDRPIYPFQTETVCQCPNCSACFHRTCSTKFGLKEVKDENLNEKDFQKNSNEDTQECQQNNCPKCLRRAKLASSAGGLFSSSPSSLLNLSPGSSHHLL